MNSMMMSGYESSRGGNIASLQRALPKQASLAKIEEVAQDFEAVFLGQMLEHMFSGIKTNEEFGGGEGEEMFRSLLVDEYGKAMSRAGGIGVAGYVKDQMLKLQEV